jgi:hypothetical protein
MLEAAYADLAFIISLKRSTLIFSYPQTGRPITPSSPPIASAVWHRSEMALRANNGRLPDDAGILAGLDLLL